jgi:nicotinamide-nucleotide amidase
MNIELITIGTELLLGFTVDTNGAEIARSLADNGVQVVRRVSVADQPDAIRAAVAEALQRTGAVLTTGGLGPTRDDVSKRVVAELYQAPLEFDESVWANLLERFARLQRQPAQSNRSQAEVPRGALVLRNRWGTAPGLWLEGLPGLTIMLPGVPQEMRKLLQHEVVPRLQRRASGAIIRSRLLRTSGIPESTLAERLGDVEEKIAPVTLAYLPGYEGVDLRLTAWNLQPDEADRKLGSAVELIRGRAGDSVYGDGDTDLAALVLERARAAGVRLAVAESCTGGLLGGRLTEIPGSSDVFVGGVIAYDNAVKVKALGVAPALLDEHGAVSEPVARAMALGAAERFGVDATLAVTGIAGPGGGTEEKPVGTVWIACSLRGAVHAKRSTFPGSRHEIRARAVQAALLLLQRTLKAGPALTPQ